jgi:dihydropteroate synthase
MLMDGGVAVLPGLSSDRCQVMGILNVTPDSFSDGGRYIQVRAAIEQGLQLVAEGADVIDVGGESTRPGATPVSVMEEIDRVVPVIAALSEAVSVPISVDTSKPEVMRAAVAAGACMINDVRALRLPGALAAAAALGVPVCLMHMQGEPATMQCNAHYKLDVVGEVMDFLAQRLAACKAAGLDEQKLMIDPGFGFGKELPHNLSLLASLDRLKTLNRPILVGVSRKSMLGQILGQRPAAGRQAASVAAALWAAVHGAAMVRVHDVAPTVDALRVWQALAAVRARPNVKSIS